jgi:hypothetical protein
MTLRFWFTNQVPRAGFRSGFGKSKSELKSFRGKT